MLKSLAICTICSLLPALALAQTSAGSPPGSLPLVSPSPLVFRPGMLCPPRSVVGEVLTALAPADARACAALALEVPELRIALDERADRVRELELRIATLPLVAPGPVAVPVPSPWPGRIAWGAVGVVVGLVAGVVGVGLNLKAQPAHQFKHGRILAKHIALNVSQLLAFSNLK